MCVVLCVLCTLFIFLSRSLSLDFQERKVERGHVLTGSVLITLTKPLPFHRLLLMFEGLYLHPTSVVI